MTKKIKQTNKQTNRQTNKITKHVAHNKCIRFCLIFIQSKQYFIWRIQLNLLQADEHSTAFKIINPNLGGGGGNFTPTTCWFSLNNSEMVKATTLAFCSIQLHLNRDIRAKFGIPYSPQSPDIGQNSDGQTGVFPISGFLVSPLQKEIVITSEPVMILAGNLDQKLNLTR